MQRASYPKSEPRPDSDRQELLIELMADARAEILTAADDGLLPRWAADAAASILWTCKALTEGVDVDLDAASLSALVLLKRIEQGASVR